MNPFDLIPHVAVIFECKVFCVFKAIGIYNLPDVGGRDCEVITVQAREKPDSVPNMQSSYRASSLLDHVIRLHSLSPMNLMLLQLVASSADRVRRLIGESI